MTARTRTFLDDLGSQVVRELINMVNSGRVHSTPVSTGVIANTATGTAILLSTEEDLVIQDVLISNTDVDGVDAATDFFLEWDTDQSFATPTAVLDIQGLDGAGNLLPATAITRASAMVGFLVTTQQFPFLLPAGASLRLRVINNEGGNRTYFASVVYKPVQDTLVLTHNIGTRPLSSKNVVV